MTALLRAAHAGPALAVTVVAALLAVAAPLPLATAAVVVLAVLAGQLVIGWSNDLVDVRRDVQVGRSDKPLATGELDRHTVQVALGVAAVAAVVLSLALGWRAGLVHLGLGVGGGLAYNLGLKTTRWSWLPYAAAFGTLPAVVTLAQAPPAWPSWPVMTAGALLGVGAHFVNVLPDLEDDAATGVRGLPHRLGHRVSQRVATAVLVLASATVVLGPQGPPAAFAWVALGGTLVLAAVALLGRGRTPFRAAIGIALVNVVMLTLAGANGP
jgi:4-hydroxybenzoate polyprenyltransferase